jgi:hypothetical protein
MERLLGRRFRRPGFYRGHTGHQCQLWCMCLCRARWWPPHAELRSTSSVPIQPKSAWLASASVRVGSGWELGVIETYKRNKTVRSWSPLAFFFIISTQGQFCPPTIFWRNETNVSVIGKEILRCLIGKEILPSVIRSLVPLSNKEFAPLWLMCTKIQLGTL